MSSTYRFFVTAPRGLEGLLAEELRAMGLDKAYEQRGGVVFEAELAGAYRACLWSRIANRVLLPLTTFSAADSDALYAGVRRIHWTEHLGAENTLAVDFTGVKARISHSRYAEQRIKDAVVDQLREQTGNRPSVDTQYPDVRINAHMQGDQVTLSIDLSGESLHRRGYRQTGGNAPLKENLAAAMLLRGDWPTIAAAGGGFVDPMCGAATLAIEAAWLAGDCAPGLLRTRFGIHRWRGHDATAWKTLLDEALERQEHGLAQLPPIVAYDHDAAAIRLAWAAIQHAGLSGRVHVERAELSAVRPPSHTSTGLVAVNPPYGERVGQRHELLPLYARLGNTLRQHFPGWRALVLNGADCAIGLRPERTWQVYNGALPCRLERFEMARERHNDAPPPAEDLVNRLHKNQRKLSGWLQQQGIGNYRIYDADIPEYALAVDVYGSREGDWLHVQEYQAPASIDPRHAQARLRAALTALPAALGVAPQRMVFKVRRRQRGAAQYTRQAAQGQFLEVTEGRCRLLVNLTDYLDTGLFLDHRPLRLWLGENAQGQRLLNLFCYTGAATVHAALGGARRTTSVDLSKTYLDWLRRNLALNGCDRPAQQMIQADCRQWLHDCRDVYDLILLDPPSFSNSKRMQGNLDIQRDHAELIRTAAARLAPDGLLIFSTNLSRFRLDPALHEQLPIEDKTAWSIPKDFQRNARIHQCWFIRRSVPQ